MVWAEVPRTPDTPSTPGELEITEDLFEKGFERSQVFDDQTLSENSNTLISSCTDTSLTKSIMDNSDFQKIPLVNGNDPSNCEEKSDLLLDNQENFNLISENENENYDINVTYDRELILPDNQEFLDKIPSSECRGRSIYRKSNTSDSPLSSTSTSRSSSSSSSDTLSSSSLYSSYSLLSTASSFTDNSSSFTEVTNLPITYLSPFPSASDLFALTSNIANMNKEIENEEFKLETPNNDHKYIEKSCIDESQDEKTHLQDLKKDKVTNVEGSILIRRNSKSLDKTDVHIHKEKTRKNLMNSAKVANKVEINKYIVWKSVTKEKSEKMCVDENNIEKKVESNNKLKEIKPSTNLDMCSEIEKRYDDKDIKSTVNKTLKREECTYENNICTNTESDKVEEKELEKDFEVKEREFKPGLTDVKEDIVSINEQYKDVLSINEQYKDVLSINEQYKDVMSMNEQYALEKCERITRRIEELSEQIKERDREIKEIQEMELHVNRPITELIKDIELIESGIKEIDVAKEVEKNKCENLIRNVDMDIPDSMKNKYLLEMQSFINRAADIEREQEHMYRKEISPLNELRRIKPRKLNRVSKPSPLSIFASCNNPTAEKDSPFVQNNSTAISVQKEDSNDVTSSSSKNSAQNIRNVTNDHFVSSSPSCYLTNNSLRNIDDDKHSVSNDLEKINPVKVSVDSSDRLTKSVRHKSKSSTAPHIDKPVNNSKINIMRNQCQNKTSNTKCGTPSNNINEVERVMGTNFIKKSHPPLSNVNKVERDNSSNFIKKTHSPLNKKSNVPPVFLATWQLQGCKEGSKGNITNINKSKNIEPHHQDNPVNAYRRRTDPSSAGLLTSCRVPQSIADTPELIKSLKDFAAHDSYSVMDYNGSITTHDTRDTTNLREFSMMNSTKESLNGALGQECQTPDSPDSGRGSMFESFDLGICESPSFTTPKEKDEKEEKDNEDLGPKFFLELCRYWPDLIVRLAHDIALESPSPEDAPDPPDPPSGKSPCTCSSTSSHGSEHDKNKVSKCCSDEDPCCPQLPPDPSSCAGTSDLMSELSGGGGPLDDIATDSPICGSPAPRRPRPRPEGSSGPSSVESEENLEINMNLASEFGTISFLDDLADDADEDPGTPAEDEDGASRPLKPRPSGEQRKRRKLPEIPKTKNSFSCASLLALRSGANLADELAEAESGVASRSSTPDTLSLINSRPLLLLKCAANLRDDSCSPDSDLRLPLNDIDSGHSTQHSPDGAKSMSPQATVNGSLSPMSPSSGGGGVPFPQLELLEATHRGLYRFIPRHHDEVEIEIGDAIYVQKEAEDLWCEGVNLRSGRQGIFPAAHVTDVDYSDFDPNVPKVKKERYLLNYLGSIETLCHKGNQVLCQAVRKIAGGKEMSHNPHPCILEVSDQGIRMVDKSKPTGVRGPCHDYFYHLKHVSFCAFHPGDHRYFGFITKHPRSQRFACHVFRSNENTRPVAEAVGRAFQRFYQKLIETAYPIEEIYLTDDLEKLHLEKLEKLQPPPPIPQDEIRNKKY